MAVRNMVKECITELGLKQKWVADVSLFPKPKPLGYWEVEYRLDVPKDFDPNKTYSGSDLIRKQKKFVSYQPIPWEHATVFNYITRTGAFRDWDKKN